MFSVRYHMQSDIRQTKWVRKQHYILVYASAESPYRVYTVDSPFLNHIIGIL